MYNIMKVQKRNGDMEDVSFDKILKRIQLLCNGEEFTKKLTIDPTIIAQKVCSEIYDGVTTTTLDELSYQIAISLYSKHPEYAILSSRICISNHHKHTPDTFSDVITKLYENDIIQEYLYTLVNDHKDVLNGSIDYMRDYDLDFFGFKTLEKSYLLKVDKEIVERPQYLFMRVALCIHRDDIQKAIDTYHHLSNKEFIHATPTLFNAGTKREQLASCFLLSMKDDSVNGIFDTLKDCATISKYSGGIGLHIHNIRANNSFIRGTNGYSNGIVPMLRVFNDTARYIDQGGGKRNGSFAMYLTAWHADVFEFLALKRHQGDEHERARSLHYAMWLSDHFMRCVERDLDWHLFCPDQCKKLASTHGTPAFVTEYERAVSARKFKRVVKARAIWMEILKTQIETESEHLKIKDYEHASTI